MEFKLFEISVYNYFAKRMAIISIWLQYQSTEWKNVDLIIIIIWLSWSINQNIHLCTIQ